MNIEQLESYNLADAVKFNDRLNPRLFGKDEHLLPEVRKHLLSIANDFREFLGVNGYELRDITISGSNAAYTYTPHSDIDLHLVVDLPQMNNEVYKELFNAKKYEYNDKHDIKISGYDVELYVQDVNQTHVSQGIYSVLNNDWVEVPRRQKHTVNDVSTRSKYQDVQQRIKQAIASDDLELMSDLKHKISDMRRAGLARNGEFGPENLAFKMLRTQGDIGRLAAALVAGRDRELSLVERRPVPVKYGFAVSEDYTKRLDWSSLDEGLSLEDKMSIFEEFYIKGNLTESIDQDKKEYFVSLFDLSTTPVKHERYIVVPLSLVNNKIMPLDQPGYMEFLARAQDSLVFKSSHGQKKYPSDIMRDLSVFHTFTFSTAADYNKFRTALVLKFNTELPAITITNEDASISPDGVNPTTKMILEKERISTQTILADFVKFCSEQLGLEKSPAIQLRRDPEWSARNKTFGRFNTETGALEVSIGNRHVMDVLRTVAHELVHQRQSELEDMPDTSGETGSKYENQANALAGVLMRDYAELHPEHFDSVTESASGYIPTKAQARDPRFAMALTKDVRPGEVARQANKLGLQVDSKGAPALLLKEHDIANSLMLEFSKFKGQADKDVLTGTAALGAESPPEFPAGTVKVDVSDVYDWYKLGQNISNLDHVDPDTLGTGPPQTILAFGSEPEEHKYLKQLKKLGLKTHDIDPPWYHDVDEDTDEDNAVMLTRLGRFHPGKDTLADIVPERQNVKYALHPDKWEATFYSLTNKDSDKLKFFGPKKIAIAAGTLVGDMAIANQFYRAKTPEDQQRYAEEYKQSLRPYPVDISQYRMPELLIPGDAEQLDELSFLGSPCTQDCSGHRAGYDWSKARGGVDAGSWSPSFNNGAGLAKAGK